MRASLRGWDELIVTVQRMLALSTKKEAKTIVNAVVTSLEVTLLRNLVSTTPQCERSCGKTFEACCGKCQTTQQYS
jgi:hypothetical protein